MIVACGIAIGARAEEKLLQVPKDIKAAYPKLLKLRGTGIIKLLPRGRYEQVIRTRGGGAYYSFFLKTHEYGHGSDIELTSGSFKVGFAGADYGFFVDLGDIPIEDVPANATIPAQLDPEKVQAWDEAWNYRPPNDLARLRQEVRPSTSRAPAVAGVTYLLRSISPDRSDTLTAVRVVKVFEDGSVILLWRGLRSWLPPQTRPDPIPFYR
jgi:hypothetical protein